MSVKQTPAGGGTEDGSGGSGAGGGGSTDDFGSINGPIARDIDALYRCAALFEAVAGRWRSFTNGTVDFATFAPLKRGQTDESWNAFSSEYFRASGGFLNVLFKMADGWASVGHALKALALASQRTEEANSGIARIATSYKGVPDPIQASGVTGLSNRLVPLGESAADVNETPVAPPIFTKSTHPSDQVHIFEKPVWPADRVDFSHGELIGTPERVAKQPPDGGSGGSA